MNKKIVSICVCMMFVGLLRGSQPDIDAPALCKDMSRIVLQVIDRVQAKKSCVSYQTLLLDIKKAQASADRLAMKFSSDDTAFGTVGFLVHHVQIRLATLYELSDRVVQAAHSKNVVLEEVRRKQLGDSIDIHTLPGLLFHLHSRVG